MYVFTKSLLDIEHIVVYYITHNNIAEKVWRGAGSCSPFAWPSSLLPSNSVLILKATFGDMWSHYQKTKRYFITAQCHIEFSF